MASSRRDGLGLEPDNRDDELSAPGPNAERIAMVRTEMLPENEHFVLPTEQFDGVALKTEFWLKVRNTVHFVLPTEQLDAVALKTGLAEGPYCGFGSTGAITAESQRRPAPPILLAPTSWSTRRRSRSPAARRSAAPAPAPDEDPSQLRRVKGERCES